MVRRRALRWPGLAAAGLLAVTMAACGGEPDDPPTVDEPPVDEPEGPDPADDEATDTDSPAEAPPPENDVPEDDGSGPVPVVTEDHDGETIAMPQEGSVVLQLSGDWFWDEPMLDGMSIELVRVDYLVDPGYQEWEVVPHAPGVTTIATHGEPNCADANACPPRDVEIRFEVVG